MVLGGWLEVDVLGKLGGGAFGEVLQGVERITGRAVALKRVPIRGGCSAGLPDVVLREVKLLQRCGGCENVVKFVGFAAMGSGVALCFELCAVDLAEAVRRRDTRLPTDAVKAIVSQLLCGLKHVHKLSCLHRDIKPGNILIGVDGTVKLADFGLARHVTGTENSLSHTVATRWYRAPELLLGCRRYTGAVDMWAVGAIAAELASGDVLIPGDSDIDQLGRVFALLGTPTDQTWPNHTELPDWGKVMFPSHTKKDWATVLPDGPPALRAFVARVLVYDPEKRLTAELALVDGFFFSLPAPMRPFELARELGLPRPPPSVSGSEAPPPVPPLP